MNITREEIEYNFGFIRGYLWNIPDFNLNIFRQYEENEEPDYYNESELQLEVGRTFNLIDVLTDMYDTENDYLPSRTDREPFSPKARELRTACMYFAALLHMEANRIDIKSVHEVLDIDSLFKKYKEEMHNKYLEREKRGAK